MRVKIRVKMRVKVMSPHCTDQMSQWSQVSRITLCMSKVKVLWLTEWVTRSPIELFWTAKKWRILWEQRRLNILIMRRHRKLKWQLTASHFLSGDSLLQDCHGNFRRPQNRVISKFSNLNISVNFCDMDLVFRCVSISINLNFTHSQTNRHIALFRKGKDLTSKDRGFRYGEYYKSHTHRGFRDLGIKGFREPEEFLGFWGF